VHVFVNLHPGHQLHPPLVRDKAAALRQLDGFDNGFALRLGAVKIALIPLTVSIDLYFLRL
jgi:hypothetical protein